MTSKLKLRRTTLSPVPGFSWWDIFDGRELVGRIWRYKNSNWTGRWGRSWDCPASYLRTYRTRKEIVEAIEKQLDDWAAVKVAGTSPLDGESSPSPARETDDEHILQIDEATTPLEALGAAAWYASFACLQYGLILDAHRPDNDLAMRDRYGDAESDAATAQEYLEAIYEGLAERSCFGPAYRKAARMLKSWVSEKRQLAARELELPKFPRNDTIQPDARRESGEFPLLDQTPAHAFKDLSKETILNLTTPIEID